MNFQQYTSRDGLLSLVSIILPKDYSFMAHRAILLLPHFFVHCYLAEKGQVAGNTSLRLLVINIGAFTSK